ncbi:MAG TPA: inositol monophosphatase family protein [Arenicellales bacterium]|nr:inositol monophosphatase family protein [Arenicellales bacterium]
MTRASTSEPESPELDTLSAMLREIGLQVLSGTCRHEQLTAKRDGSYVTDIDLALQQRIRTALAESYPDIPFFGEETPESERDRILRSGASRVWCLDPLDGTTNFTSGLPFYGISLALLEDRVPVLGVVFDPNRDECFSARVGGGAWLNGERLPAATKRSTAHCVACVDFKRLPRTVAEHLVARPPFKSQRNLGACVLEWCWLAADRFQLYLHGGQHLWDYAAGSLILREAGGSAVTLEGAVVPGTELYLNRKVSVAAASHPDMLEEWWSWITDRADLYTLLVHRNTSTRDRG